MVTRILICLGFVILSAEGKMTARQVVETSQKRHKLKNETVTLSITLIDRRGNRETRMLQQLARESESGLDRALSVFKAPADVRGTALLTRENAGRDNDQWLYLPSQRRLMRIAQARRNGYFMGTDFTYEDMDPQNIDHYTYRLLPEREADRTACYVIEAAPTEEYRRSSGYSKRILWVRRDIFFTVRIEFYDRRGKLVKTQDNSKLEKVGATAWRADEALIDNLAKKHRTLVKLVSRDITTELPENRFTERHILTGRYLE